MKIFRRSGPLVLVVGMLSALVVLTPATAGAQSAHLAGAVRALREAEKQAADSSLDNALGEASKALKRCEKLASRGEIGPLLDEIAAVRPTLVGLLEQAERDDPSAAPAIDRALNLVDDAVRAAGRYQATSDTALGLHTTTLASLHGTVSVYLPENIRVGDTVSGAVEVTPVGATPEERQRNGATLTGVVITLEGDETPAADGSVVWQVPPIENGAPATLVLRDPSGVEVGRTAVPVNPVPDRFGPLETPMPSDFEVPPIVQFGNPFTITGPFDGQFVTTAVDLGGELTVLAESPRALIARAPMDLVGQHPMTLAEGETVVTREVNVIQLHLSAGKLDLLKGETTIVTARVIGFTDLDPEAYPIEFEMINHSPDTVTMEGLEDNRFYQLIFADDVTTIDAVSSEASFVVESTLHGVRTGTFNISATVTSPMLFDILGPGEQLACSEDKRYRLLCVRFIIIDQPGAKDRATDGTGLLEGVKYDGKNIGQVSEATVAAARAALEKANAIWLQCFAHCCWIRFELHTEDGKPAVYALDPKKFPVVRTTEHKIVHPPHRGRITVTETVDLTQLLDNQNSRNVTMNDGGKRATSDKRVTWAEDVGSDIKKGDSATAAVENAARDVEDDDWEKYYEGLAETSNTKNFNVVEAFGALIDQQLGAKCVNVFLVNSLTDTADNADESGFATVGGRNIFLEEGVLASDTGAVFAHELGHNLGLKHVDDATRLMNGKGAGTILTKDDCETACNTAIADEDLKPATLSEDTAKDRHDALEEERRKAEEARNAREEEERRKAESEEQRRQELEKIDARLTEIDRRVADLEKKIEAEEASFRKTVEDMRGISDADKQKILDDNLPSRAKKEKAELETLQQEKSGLEEKKAGLQQ